MMVVVVVPAFNEVARIGAVVRELVARDYTVVVVDDGSVDGTGPEAKKHGAILVQHEANQGQGAALNTGVRYASQLLPRVVVTFDADGQHSVGDIPKIIAPILNQCTDVALGSRFLGQAVNISLARALLLRMAVLFTKVVTGFKVTDCHNGLRALSPRAARLFRLDCHRMGHASEIYDWIRDNDLDFVEVGVTITYNDVCLEKGQKNLDFLKILSEYGLFKVRRVLPQPIEKRPAEVKEFTRVN